MRTALGVAGYAGLATLIVVTGILATGAHPWWQRLLVCACLVGTSAITVGIFLFLRHALERFEDAAEIVWDIGVIIGAYIAVIVLYAVAYAVLGLAYTVDIVRHPGVTIAPLRHDYASAIYFSAITLSTLGYGDFQPSTAARGITAFQGINGFFLLSILVSYCFRLLEARVSGAGR